MQNDTAINLFKVAEVELVYRSLPQNEYRPVITCAAISYNILKNHWDENKMDLQEQFKILLLNTRYACLGIVDIATGGLNSCIADTRLIFSCALKANASSIILAHNHPSGSLTPSDADKKLTERLVKAGKHLQINVLDHLILSSQGYTAFSEQGLMP